MTRKESDREMPTTLSIKGHPFFCSWSGGKDSCLALYHAIQNEGIPKALLTMLTEDGKRSRSHGLPAALIRRQAEVLGIPLIVCHSSWGGYEENFLSAIYALKGDDIGYGSLVISTWRPILNGLSGYAHLWRFDHTSHFGNENARNS